MSTEEQLNVAPVVREESSLNTTVQEASDIDLAEEISAPSPVPLGSVDSSRAPPAAQAPDETGPRLAAQVGLAPGPLGTFGKYTLQRAMGAGGMAQIYEGIISGPSGFTKRVVIKTILPEYAALGDFKHMFINEAKVAALLNHPNIVQIFDFGAIDERLFIAMEHVDGASLQQILLAASRAGMVLGTRYAVNVGIAMCEALTYVSRLLSPEGKLLNIVHRDITPGNILVSRQGVVKLTDFGVVKSSINTTGTQAGTIKGKYAYMSPEQIQGKVVDHRSDIFSLGIVMYEIATQRRLFKRNSLAETVTAVGNAEAPRPSTLVAGFPAEFERILMKALSGDAAVRYQTAGELLNDLEAFRLARGWTSGGRELSGLLEALFPSGFPVGTEQGSRSSSVAKEDSVPGLESAVHADLPPWAAWAGVIGGLTLLTAIVWLIVLW